MFHLFHLGVGGGEGLGICLCFARSLPSAPPSTVTSSFKLVATVHLLEKPKLHIVGCSLLGRTA